MDAVAGDDGTVFIANAGANQIVAADSTGAVLWTAGRRGEGPAEFRALGSLDLQADTLIALDGATNRFSLWSRAGDHYQTERAVLPLSEPVADALFIQPAFLVGRLADGRIVARGPDVVRAAGNPGMRRTRATVRVLSRDGHTLESFTLPGIDVYELRTPGRLPAVLAPMSRNTALTVWGDQLVWASADAYEVRILHPDGTADRTFRIDEPPRPVTAAIADAYRADWSPWFPVSEPIPDPPYLPTFDRVFVSRDGRIWARRYDWGNVGEEWIVFTRSGEVEALRFPPGDQVVAADRRHAWAISRDSLDVEQILRYEIDAES